MVFTLERDEIFVALLTNVRAVRNRLPDIALGLAAYLYNRTPAPPRPSLADSLRSGIAAGTATWPEGPQDIRRFDVDEADLNVLRYELLSPGQKAEAVRIFELNRTVFPSSANALDSLADAYLAVGDTAAAVRALQALEHLVVSKAGGTASELRLLANARRRLSELAPATHGRQRQ